MNIDLTSPTYLIVIVASVLIAMTIHEAVHAYVGFRLGDTTAAEEGRLSLNPLRHIDPIMTLVLPVISIILLHAPILAAKPVPFTPDRIRFGEFGAALIAAAGPLSNLVLAIIGALLLRAMPVGQLAADALYTFISLNVSLFVFNLLPVPPLDGSRVLYAFAPEPVQQFMRSVEPYGFVLIVLLVVAGGFGGILVTLNHFILQALVG